MGERKLLFLMNQAQAKEFARLLGAAERGDGAAACRLGDMYREALGGLQFSPKHTYRWYAKSALAGDANGQNNLGACYEHGLGCVQSYAKAVKWYRLAAAQGLAYASSNLGYCGEAARWHGAAKDQGPDRGRDRTGKALRPGRRCWCGATGQGRARGAVHWPVRRRGRESRATEVRR